MAQTLMRATRLAQVISVLGNEKDLETTVERAAIEVGELFFADMALLILDSDDGLSDRGPLGRRGLRPAAASRSRCPPSRTLTSVRSGAASVRSASCRCPSGWRPIRRATSPGRDCSSATSRSD